MRPARVIGAGLSGLAAAWHLADRGFDVTVMERAAVPGGLIQTRRSHHGLVERAANAFVWDDVVADWFRRLDLTPVFPRPESRRRYIFRDGPRRWPLSISESLVLASRLTAAALSRSLNATGGESMARWGERVVGRVATRWLLEPAMQGIYAAPASELSASVVFGGRRKGPRRLAAPPDGMGQFICRLHDRLRGRGVRFEFNADVTALDAGHPTVVATNAAAAARLLAPHTTPVAEAVAAIRMAPLVTVTSFFEPHPSDLHGFGMLFPADAGVHALGVLFPCDIFDNRGDTRAETWIVGDRDRRLTAWSDVELRAILAADRHRVTGRHAHPLATYITRWPQAIPVYDDAVRRVMDAQKMLPAWLALAGNYLGAIGVAALLRHAAAAADRLASPWPSEGYRRNPHAIPGH
jgi:oxygen-dependent protoporphyrinogen oxidase